MYYRQLYSRSTLSVVLLLAGLLAQPFATAAETHEPSLLASRDLNQYREAKYFMYIDGPSSGDSRIPLAIGSGLVPIATVGDTTIVAALSDRGPNVAVENASKSGPEQVIFPTPDFIPVLVPLALRGSTLSPLSPRLLESSPLKARPDGRVELTNAPGSKVSGLPTNSEHEMAVGSDLKEIRSSGSSYLGVDTEAVTFDTRRGILWVSEEYAPSIFSVDPKSGKILSIRRPGVGLPKLLLKRAPNRGFEALTYTPSDHLVAVLQSPLFDAEREKAESFVRLLTIPADATSQAPPSTRALPLPTNAQPSTYKIGDVAALSASVFLALEAYQSKDEEKHHHLLLLDTGKAREIDSEKFLDDPQELPTPVSRKILLDFKDFEWDSGKIEGLAVINERTLLISKDNDFGIKLKKGGKKRPLPREVAFKDIPTEFLILEFKKPLIELLPSS
jgi:hypothetical protein